MERCCTGDAVLLRRYATERAEDAFSAIVERHISLVYSVALRRVGGNTSMAEDISQSVFTALARQAERLALHPALEGWLYSTTYRTAALVLRRERRRQRREAETQAMQELEHAGEPEVDWSHLRPVIDDAMHELREADRLAIVLRCFEHHSFAEIAARLGMKENAARMRFHRALEILRLRLARLGLTSTAAALATALTSEAVTTAPVSITATVTSKALAALGGSTVIGTLVNLMATTSTKLTGIAAALVLASATTAIVVQHHTLSDLRADNAALRRRLAVAPPDIPKEFAPTADHAELERRRNEHLELLRLRGEVGMLRAQAAEDAAQRAKAALESSRAGSRTSRQQDAVHPDASPLVPAGDWRNIGFQAPSNTLQTLEWAKANRATNVIASALAWSDELSRGQIESIFAAAPESIRAQFGTADAYVLSLFDRPEAPDDRHRVEGYRILEERTGDDETMLQIEYQYGDGSTAVAPRRYVRIDSRWLQALNFDARAQGKMAASLGLQPSPPP